MHTGIGVNAGMRVNMGSQVLQGPQLLLVGVALLAAALVLQVFLSRRKSRWPGLVLPGARAVYASVHVMNAARTGASGGLIGAMLTLHSGPVLVLLIVYALCRWSLRRRKKEEL